EIHLHLQSIGKYIKAEDVVRFMGTPEMLERTKRTKPISVITARAWLARMGYRWKRDHRGQYVDGHEREDVVTYRNKIFLPAMAIFELKTRKWVDLELDEEGNYTLHGRRVVIWYHDESTFYAHDRRKSRWVAPGEAPIPQPKGEGVSLMVADF
ncbi:uncharacterized protein STEHIDRAFT_29607, partial [Stereum hirsutum FP-91666 SS1]|uniref:uncharacterized protein n=1 Tax=Stereum hirsutum (strain FP-91666) TaxID=721885 RepID=UPI000440F322